MNISKLSRRFVAVLVACGLLGAAHQAGAQATIKPPETYNPIDANGISLLGGSFSPSTPTLTIGPKGGGLSYSQSYDGNVGGWRESTSGMIATSTLVYPAGPDPWYTAVVMGQSIAFKRTGDTFAPSEGDNATLVLSGGVYTLTLADGTVATFSTATPGGVGMVANLAFLGKIVQPNGRTIDFNYASVLSYGTPVYRLQSVTSSDGYQLHFDYATDAAGGVNAVSQDWYRVVKVTGLNNAVDACAPLAFSCSYSRTWPSLTFGGTATDHTVTDALDRTTHYVFTGGLLTGVRRPGRASGFDVSVSYNGESQMVETAITDAGTWTYVIPDAYRNGFPAAPNQVTTNSATQVTDPLGHTRIVTSRSILVDLATKHRVTRLRAVVNGVNKGTLYGYDSNFRLSSIQQPEGNAMSYAFDARGNITTVTRGGKAGSGLSQTVASASYPATCDTSNFRICNKPTTVTDARGAVTTYTYDPAHGGVLTVTSPAPTAGAAQPQTRTSYAAFQAWFKNGAGAIVQDARPIYLPTATSACATQGPAIAPAAAPCAGTADEVRSATAYQVGNASTASNLLAVSTTSGNGLGAGAPGALAATTTVTYTENGDPKAVDGPLDGAADTTRTYYDNVRQATGVISPDPDGTGALLYRASRTTYNPDGQVTAVETGTATNQSDSGMSTFSPLQTVSTGYDIAGRKTSDSLVVNGVVQTLTQYGYDAANRLICQAVRMAPTATQAASACSPLLRDDGYDRVTYTDYDNADRVTKITSGYGSDTPRIEKTITYTDNDKEKTVADGNGNLTTYDYDVFDRLAKVSYPNAANGAVSSTSDYEEYGYDTADNRTSWRRRYENTPVAFTYDALNRANNGLRGEVYGYDNLGRQISAAYAGDTAAATYDALGRMMTERTNNQTLSYQYDLAGSRTRITWPDAFFVSYDYDFTGAITAIRENGVGPSAFTLALLTYDNLGRRTAIYRANSAQSYLGYDAASRLNSLALDMAGTTNDQTWTFAYNAASQVKTRTANNPLYEWAGTQAAKSYEVNGLNQYAKAAGVTIAYDPRGNLSNDGTKTYQYDLLNNLTSTSAGDLLTYEPTGRLWRTSANGTNYRYLLYSGPDLVAEYDVNGMVRRYVPGPGTDAPVVWYEGAGTTDRRWLLADPQGSIVVVTNASGASIATNPNTYDEYGIPAAGNVGRFQYTGQIWLPELGLYHYKARAYSPTLGRFLQTDPIGYGDGLNWYAYVGNDPLNGSDPTGMIQPDCHCSVWEDTSPMSGARPDAGGGARQGGTKSFERGVARFFGVESSDPNVRRAPGSESRPDLEEIMEMPGVNKEVTKAWTASTPNDPNKFNHHENGFWVYVDSKGGVSIQWRPRGTYDGMDEGTPRTGNFSYRIWFHTHPNTISQGFDPAPSTADSQVARRHSKTGPFSGVVKSHEGMFYYGN